MLPHHTPLTKYLFFIFVFVVVVYAYMTAQNFLYGPRIVINAPAEGITVHTQAIEITGTTKNVSVLRLEGGIIPIDEHGTFVETLLVAPGVNTFTLVAEDTFGRNKTEVLRVLFVPEEPAATENLSPMSADSTPMGDLLE